MAKNTQVVPAFPVPYVRKKRRKKPGPKKDYDKVRASPAMRAGQRFKTVCVTEEGYHMLKELSAFYKVPMGFYIYSLLVPAFDQATQESLTLQRIEENRKKAERAQEALTEKEPDEIQNRTQPARRTHF
jgi:hypothetical protein